MEQGCSENIERVLAVHNFSNEEVTFTIPDEITLPLNDLLSSYEVDASKNVLLEPYQMMWLKGTI
jgi:sucrose phosphorylase